MTGSRTADMGAVDCGSDPYLSMNRMMSLSVVASLHLPGRSVQTFNTSGLAGCCETVRSCGLSGPLQPWDRKHTTAMIDTKSVSPSFLPIAEDKDSPSRSRQHREHDSIWNDNQGGREAAGSRTMIGQLIDYWCRRPGLNRHGPIKPEGF